MDVFCLSSFCCIHSTDWARLVLCLISVLHSMMLLLHHQSHCLLTWWERESELLMDVFGVSFLCLHHPDWVQWVLCLISMIHSMMLLLCLLCCCLLIRERGKRDLLMDIFCVSSFVCLHISDLARWVLCLISMLHPTTLLLCLQYRWLLAFSERKEWIADRCLLCVFFCLHISDRALWVLCLISVPHSMMLLLFLQSCSLYMIKKRSELLMDFFCMSSFFCLHLPDRVQWVLCLISMIHSMTLPLYH